MSEAGPHPCPTGALTQDLPGVAAPTVLRKAPSHQRTSLREQACARMATCRGRWNSVRDREGEIRGPPDVPCLQHLPKSPHFYRRPLTCIAASHLQHKPKPGGREQPTPRCPRGADAKAPGPQPSSVHSVTRSGHGSLRRNERLGGRTSRWRVTCGGAERRPATRSGPGFGSTAVTVWTVRPGSNLGVLLFFK